MIERLQEQLLELVRSALWGTEPDVALFKEEVDWSKIFDIARKQTVLTMIVDVLESMPAKIAPPKALLMKAHMLLVRNRQMYQREAEVIQKLYRLLADAGVTRPVLLKGLGIAQNYPDPAARAVGDIDLYVGSREWKQARAAIEAIAGAPEDEHDKKHLHYTIDDIPIELHYHVINNRSIVRHSSEADIWSIEVLDTAELRKIEMEGDEITIPPYTFDAFFLFYHTWHHYVTSGVGLRQLCDMALYMHHHSDNIDMVELQGYVDRYGLTEPCQLFMSILVDLFGLSPERVPYYVPSPEKIDPFLARIWSGGNFGHHSETTERSDSFFVRRKRQIVRGYNNYGSYRSLFPEYARLYLRQKVEKFAKSSVAYILRRGK